MKKTLASAIALLRQAEKDWTDPPKGKGPDKGQKGRDKARKEIQKAILILEKAIKIQSGDGGDDKNP